MEWRTISSFPLFEASDQGDIRRRWKRGCTGAPGKIRAMFPSWNGYLAVHIGEGDGLRMVNRLVCEAWHGPAPTPEHQAAHDNGNRTDNRPLNLCWKTRTENYQDQIRHGTSKRGEGHHFAKLCAEEVQTIRALAGTITGREIARRYSLTEGHVSQIISRKLWSHI